MNKKILVGLGVLILAGLVWAGTDLLVTGNLLVNGDNETDGDILGHNNLSVDGGGQFGQVVSASGYLGETIETHAFAGNSCNNACAKWTTTTYGCVEALNGAIPVACSSVSGGPRFDCLCKS